MSMSDDVQNQATQPDGAGEQPAAPTFSQHDVDRIAGSARDEGRKAALNQLTEKYGNLDELLKIKQQYEEQREREMTEAERLHKQLDELKTKMAEQETVRQQAEMRALRLQVGQEVGLSPTLATRLVGETAEELKADAEKVLAELKGHKPSAPDLNATSGGTEQRTAAKLTPEQRAMADQFGISYERYADNLKRTGG